VKRLFLPAVFLAAFLLLHRPGLAYAQQKLAEDWYTLLLNGTAVGYLHQTTWRTPEGRFRSELEQSMRVRRFEVPFTVNQKDIWLEEGDGALISLSSELDMNGQKQSVAVEAGEGGLTVRLAGGGGGKRLFLPAEQEVLGLYAATRLAAGAVSGTLRNSELHYRLFSPETLKIEEVRLRVLGPGELEDSRGRLHRGVLVEEESSALPGVVSKEVLGDQGELLYCRTPAGLALEVVRVPPGQATERPGPDSRVPAGGRTDEAAVFDVASLAVEVRGLEELPGPLSRLQSVTLIFHGRESGLELLEESIRSAVADLSVGSMRDGGHSQDGTPLQILEPSADSVARTGGLIVRLERAGFRSAEQSQARRDSEEGAGDGGGQSQNLKLYTRDGYYLSLDDPRLRGLLSRCPPGKQGQEEPEIDGRSEADQERMECLERLVYQFIRSKSLAYGFAGVKEILSSRAGDCTEHALLLVALLRKLEIPSRLAYGLILTEGGLIGHAWSEAFVAGRWRWLDPSFPRGEPYGLKIRLGTIDPADPAWAQMGLTLLQVAGTVEAEVIEGQFPAAGN
jgi:hypothetical protein